MRALVLLGALLALGGTAAADVTVSYVDHDVCVTTDLGPTCTGPLPQVPPDTVTVGDVTCEIAVPGTTTCYNT